MWLVAEISLVFVLGHSTQLKTNKSNQCLTAVINRVNFSLTSPQVGVRSIQTVVCGKFQFITEKTLLTDF